MYFLSLADQSRFFFISKISQCVICDLDVNCINRVMLYTEHMVLFCCFVPILFSYAAFFQLYRDVIDR